MQENFRKIKKKYMTAAIIASVVLGVCCGVALTCALAVVFKRTAVQFHFALYFPIAIVLSLLFAALFFLLLRPRDRKIAKKLDRQYALGQKVQTMVECRKADTAMVLLQREQTENILGEVAKKRIDLSFLFKYLAIPVLAIAMIFVGIFVPAKKTVQVDPPFDITITQEAALRNLIKNVEESRFTEGVKLYTKEALEGLLEELKTTHAQSAMKAKVITVVRSVDATVAKSNSYLKLYTAIKDDEPLKPLAEAIVNGVTFYKPTAASIVKFGDVEKKSESNDGAISAELGDWGTSFIQSLQDKPDGGDYTPKPATETARLIKEYAQALTRGLEKAEIGGADKDALCIAVTEFASALLKASEETNGWGAQDYLDLRVGEVVEKFKSSAFVALGVQSYDCIMDEYVRNELARIFGIKRSELGSNDNVAPNVSGDEDGKPGGGGGWGGGDELYGSDDLVLDPDSGELVPYGQLIDRYYAMVDERLSAYAAVMNDENATAEARAEAKYVQEELAKYIRQYFQLLYSGIEDEK